ncbi:hypothetical protein ACLB2K_007116 [Fragaria x ananassa]
MINRNTDASKASQESKEKYDGLHDVASVPIDSFPVWVEMLGLPPRLMTNEAAEKVGVTLGHVDQGVWALGIGDGGCDGPLALAPRSIYIESMRTLFGYGGASKVLETRTLNLIRGKV